MTPPPYRASRRLLLGAGAAAGAGWLALLAGLFLDPARTCFAYLAAYLYVLTIALGALCLVMIAHASNARWFVVVRRVAEAAIATLPLLALLFVPLFFALGRLYPWVPPLDHLGAEAREVIEKKQAYLNVPFFVVRSLVYLAVWSVLALVLRGWSLRQDRDASRPLGWAAGVSGAGLMLFGFTETFAAFDWIMSLSATWQSTMFGVYVFAGAMVGGLAAMVVLTRTFEHTGALDHAVAASHYHALGRLLLTFVVFWAYIAYSQSFLIWIADLPHETRWVLDRVHGGWGWLFLLLGLGHFALPFLLLLWRSNKRSGARLAAIGAWLLLMHYVDVFWLVLPALHGGGTFHWLDAPALLAVCGTTVAFGAWMASGHPLVPLHDDRLAAAVRYESP